MVVQTKIYIFNFHRAAGATVEELKSIESRERNKQFIKNHTYKIQVQ